MGAEEEQLGRTRMHLPLLLRIQGHPAAWLGKGAGTQRLEDLTAGERNGREEWEKETGVRRVGTGRALQIFNSRVFCWV